MMTVCWRHTAGPVLTGVRVASLVRSVRVGSISGIAFRSRRSYIPAHDRGAQSDHSGLERDHDDEVTTDVAHPFHQPWWSFRRA